MLNIKQIAGTQKEAFIHFTVLFVCAVHCAVDIFYHSLMACRIPMLKMLSSLFVLNVDCYILGGM